MTDALTLTDVLSEEDIADFCTDSAFAAGRRYQRQERVAGLTVTADLTHISAKVQGTAPRPYATDIHLDLDDVHVQQINGSCSCPVGFNCKHVVATLFEALQTGGEVAGPPQTQSRIDALFTPSRPAPVIDAAERPSPEVAQWLEIVGKAARAEVAAPEAKAQVAYILAGIDMRKPTLFLGIEVVSVRRDKNGAYKGKTGRQNLNQFDPLRAPAFYRDSDLKICSLLSRTSGYSYGSPAQHVHPSVQREIMERVMATGRAYWQSPNKPLSWSGPRQGKIVWETLTSGVQPVLKVDGAIALNGEPPVYVDPNQGTIGELDLPVAPQLAYRLLSAPVIAPGQVQAVAEALGGHLPAEMTPPPPQPPLIIDGDPVPVVTLRTGRVTYYQSYSVPAKIIPLATLGFRYGPLTVDLGEARPVITGVHEGRRFEVIRRPELEREALARLLSVGLAPSRGVYPALEWNHERDVTFSTPAEWYAFLSRDKPVLDHEGFIFVTDVHFPYNLVAPGSDFTADITPSGTDWFDLDLGVEVDGKRVDLGNLLADLVRSKDFDVEVLKQIAGEEGSLYLPMLGGRILTLTAAHYLPVILALYQLQQTGVSIRNGARLSRAELALLAGVEADTGAIFRGQDGLRQMARRLGATSELTAPVLPKSFSATLRPYQAEGMAWLDLLRETQLGGILADDMGLGKTVQILALLAVEKAAGRLEKPALILAPTSLMGNWQNEARRFAPDLRTLVLHGSGRKALFDDIADSDIVLTTYPLISKDHPVLLACDWHMAVLDEAQTIKNPNAQTTRLLRDLKAVHRFCLTGTPMENHLGEMWSLMNFVNPGYLGDKTEFGRTWRNPIEKHGDTGRQIALARRIRPFMLRRTKAVVAHELPPKTDIVEPIIFEPAQRQVYDAVRMVMHKRVRDAIAEKGLAKSHIVVLDALLKLRQVCCDPRLLPQDDGKAPAPSAKLERLMEMLEELLSEGRKIVVFSQFTSMLALIIERLDAAGIAFSLLTGTTRDRPAAVDRFQSGEVNLFLVSLKAGGVGLNLTAADTVILYDPWWNPAVEAQAIDRAYRIGQDKPVFVYRMTASDTIEDKMTGLKAKKQALADGLFDEEGGVSPALSEDDIAELFGA
ncbi:DEAD/DEAH box helicase [Asticcacaulis biprosthecium]|uniref:DEAD/DEAH box helicase n=1 Tax=Asticcacaulis biprosthecium TaxID=76891 RepID=UPI000301612D|nr:DEAD/DEAH box helicase [Asticcacaulis biprosthecium]